MLRSVLLLCTQIVLHSLVQDNAGVIVNDKGEMKGSAIQARPARELWAAKHNELKISFGILDWSTTKGAELPEISPCCPKCGTSDLAKDLPSVDGGSLVPPLGRAGLRSRGGRHHQFQMKPYPLEIPNSRYAGPML